MDVTAIDVPAAVVAFGIAAAAEDATALAR
jgi:hypothetical protein